MKWLPVLQNLMEMALFFKKIDGFFRERKRVGGERENFITF